MSTEQLYKVVHRTQRAPGGGWWVEPVLRRLTLKEAQRECRAMIQHQQGPGVYTVEPESGL